MDAPLLLPIRDAAREAGLGRDFTYGLVRRGELGTVQVGARRLVPRGELLRWIEANTKRSPIPTDAPEALQ